MVRSSEVHESLTRFTEADAIRGSNDLAILGRTSGSPRVSVHSQTESPRPSGPVTTANVLRLLEWQQYRCALTGRTLTPETASLDHIVPVRSGGEHRIENTHVLHKDVNKAKTTMTSDEFLQLCREIVLHAACHVQEGETR